mmetsp:Transcript_380/g.959  ORF Transcript_380/g.959 Transcript_380/m.959 type:complete len:246 (-) Transcript_380:936-1673(-)
MFCLWLAFAGGLGCDLAWGVLVTDAEGPCVGGRAVLGAVQALAFDVLRHPDAHRGPHHPEREPRQRQRPRGNGEHGDELHGELLAAAACRVWGAGVGAAAEEDVVVGAEDARRQQPPRPAAPVDRKRVQRVVDLESEEDDVSAVVHHGRHAPDQEGLPRVEDGAACGDADEGGEDAIERDPDVERVLEHARNHNRNKAPARGGDGGGHGDFSGHVGGAAREHQRRPAVEAVPAEPKDESPQAQKR